MQFKLRADLDLYQRWLLVLACGLLAWHLPVLGWLLAPWLPLLVSLGLLASVLPSCLQLDVEDKAVLVTGCDTGFGLALAKHLEGLGFTVFAGCLLADKHGAGAVELRENTSGRMHVVQLDVTKEEDWQSALSYVKENLPVTANGLWGVVNNAGWASFGEVEWVGMDTYKRAADINVFGLIRGIQIFLPLLRGAKGRVVTITSGLGRMAVPTRSSYVFTKYALEGFHDCLRYEIDPFGVKVSVLEPGNCIADTNIFNETFVKSQADLMWDNMNDEVKSAYGKPYFDQKVAVMRSYMNNGIPDISPVIDSYTDALLDVFPQKRYQPMDLYFKIRCFLATHAPEIIYDLMYIGITRKL